MKVGLSVDYPYSISVNVEGFFNNKPIKITLYSGLTTFVGTNASGKTKTLKAIRDALKGNLTGKKVRYLSSNRIGNMEEFRSRASHNYYNSKDFSFGSRGAKQYRHDIETSYGDFYTMDERKDICLKVAERLNILFQRNIYLHWDSGFMKVIMEKQL